MESGIGIAVLGALMMRVPVFVVWMVAVVLAVIRWERHRTVSLLVVVALAVESVLSVVGMAVAMALPSWMVAKGMGTAQIAAMTSMVSLVQSLLSAACWALLIGAVFMDRKAPAQSPASAVPVGPAAAAGPR